MGSASLRATQHLLSVSHEQGSAATEFTVCRACHSSTFALPWGVLTSRHPHVHLLCSEPGILQTSLTAQTDCIRTQERRGHGMRDINSGQDSTEKFEERRDPHPLSLLPGSGLRREPQSGQQHSPATRPGAGRGSGTKFLWKSFSLPTAGKRSRPGQDWAGGERRGLSDKERQGQPAAGRSPSLPPPWPGRLSPAAASPASTTRWLSLITEDSRVRGRGRSTH